MTTLPIGLWLLAPIAAAGPGNGEAELQATRHEACAKDTPEGFQIHSGFATDPDPSKAMATALRDARIRAIETICAGKSEWRCHAITRHIEQWKQPWHHPETGEACALVGVNRKWIDDVRGDQARLETELEALGARVATEVSGPLVVRPPAWLHSGCHAGEVGNVVRAAVHNGLARQGGVRLVPEATGEAAVLHLNLELAEPEVRLGVNLARPGVMGVTPLSGTSFAMDLYAVDRTHEDCRFDSQLGLGDGQRSGQDGLQVWTAMASEGAVYCDGDRTSATVHVSRPATVKVFSVERSGTALLVWPPPGQSGRVESSAQLGTFTLHSDHERGEEKLVALAVEDPTAWGHRRSWTGFCRSPGIFDADSAPAGAAAGAATYRILPLDADRCLQRVGPQPNTPVLPDPVDIPVCPEVR